MSAHTNVEAMKAYVAKNRDALTGHDVEVVALLGMASALDESFSGALLGEYRKYKQLLDQAIQEADSSKDDEPEDEFTAGY